MTDVDDRVLIDYWFNATSLILGHSHPRVIEAVERQLAKGTAFYGPGEIEIEHAQALLPRITGGERIRYTNSGSEAVMLALRLARAFTGRTLIAKFEGAYHGIYDDVAWSVAAKRDQLGPVSDPVPSADSAGLPSHDGRTMVLPFNDVDAALRVIERNADQMAAIIVEPMANRIGMILPEQSFITALRSACDKHGILLVFDEIVSFRVGYNGAAALMGVVPDLTTLGKFIGGGFPVGAVVGRADILDRSAPSADTRVVHAGTFNANPVTMAAGLATLHELTPSVIEDLARIGRDLRARLAAICEGLPLQVTGAGSLFKISALVQPIRSYRDSVQADGEWEETASLRMLNLGILMTPKLQGCISTTTTPTQIDQLVGAFQAAIDG